MKYCTHCGKELFDEAVVCVGCGCPVTPKAAGREGYFQDTSFLLHTLSQRMHTNGVIWLVIGILQILGGLLFSWFLVAVGALNIVSSIQDMSYSKELLHGPSGIVAKFEPVTGPIITLVYNLVFGGLVGVVGSIYYFVAIRNYVMEHKQFFGSL